MNQGRFHRCVGSRRKVALLGQLLYGLLLVTVLVCPSYAQTGVVSLPEPRDGFSQVEFFDVNGITMNGQILSLDFMFTDGFSIRSRHPVWAEIFLQTGPHNAPNPDGDYPYTQYVIFQPGTSAYLINERRERLDVPMSDWRGGLTVSPAPTLGVLSTERGNAGADMLAYPTTNESIAGIHYDLVLPSTGETIYLGRIGFNLQIVSRSNSLGSESLPGDFIDLSTPAISESITQPPDDPVTFEPEVDPITVQPQVDRTPITSPFVLADLGAVVKTTAGRGTLVTGYGILHPDGGATPSAFMLLEDRRPGFLVSEMAVADSPLIQSGRVYIEVSDNGSVTTEVVVANPNNVNATVTFEIRDQQGTLQRVGTFAVPAGGQVSRLLDEYPFHSGRGVRGTLTLTSTLPVSMFAFRGVNNDRNEYLMTPLWVVDLTESYKYDAQVISHYAVGDGNSTKLVLVNPTGATITGAVEFLSTFGSRIFISLDGFSYQVQAFYSIPPYSSETIEPAAVWPNPIQGAIRITPAGNSPSPAAMSIVSVQNGYTRFNEYGVRASSGTAFRMYAQLSPSDQTQTGISVAGPPESDGTLWVSLTGADGSLIAIRSYHLPAGGQFVDFMGSMFPELAGTEVQGVLRVTTDLPFVSLMSYRLHYNPRQEPVLSAIPPIVEGSPPTTADRYFPFFINGEGFATRIVIYSGRAGESSSGNVSFFRVDGTPIDLEIP